MKISIVVGGRFHGFDLAEQLEKKSLLNQLITSYPKSYVIKNYNINEKKIISIIFKEIFSRGLNKIGFLNRFFEIEDFIINYFGKAASKKISLQNLDILVGWSSFSLESFKRVKKNCVKILERGSTHIEYQKNILKEEYDLLGIKKNLPSNQIIQRELEEYEISDYISVPSEFVKKTFLNKGIDENKIIKVPYGVNLKHFYKIKNSDNFSKFRVICVGSISVRKGVIYLLKAFSQLNLPNSELLIIGNIEEEMKPLIKKFINNDKIKFVGIKNQNQLVNYYNISNLFVTCSIEEGLSMVQAQAMACGLPVVCTPNTGGEEIIDDNINGYILPIRNIEILKEKIEFLYNNKDQMDTMGNNAIKKASNFLSWENYGKKMIDNYYKIIN